ncbi:MAG: tetratricopeptide repeat protein [Limisphaerales bacterium]
MALASATAFFLVEGPKTSPRQGSRALRSRGQQSDAAVFAAYAGSARCQECHPAEADLWKKSHHALAERALVPELDRSAFEPPRAIKHGVETSEAKAAGDRLQIVTLGVGGQREAFAAGRVIGVEPLRQFLVAAPGGRFQVTELAFDALRQEWFDVFGSEDRKPGEWGHWTGRGMTWNAMCAACHNTRLRKNYRAVTDTYATTMAEQAVGCEACHGPMAGHVAWQRKHEGSNRGRVRERAVDQPWPQDRSHETRSIDPTIQGLSRDQAFDTCGSCHARRAELTGDFFPGERFLDHYTPVIPDETDVFHADGQVHEEDYEYASFLGSRMHAAGVRCVDCHEPHSGKTRARDNALCLRCHQGQMPAAPKIDPAAHTHHAVGKPGGRCVDCHMPQTVYMQRHARRDHGFTVPDPLLTKQFGIPNACNRCHADRDTTWALAAVEKWYGVRMERPTRLRAQTIAQARAGQAASIAPLARMLREEKIPLWRAVAAGLLKRWATEPKAASALVACADDANPLVRAMAARALEPLARSNVAALDEPTLTRPPATLSHPMVEGRGEGAPVFMAPKDHADPDATLRRLLNDPVRAVRVEAAWALRSTLDTNSLAGSDLFCFLAHNLDEPNGALQMGVFDLDRGQNEPALAWFRQAVNWDPGSPPLRQALAVGLSLAGEKTAAAQELETACRLAPRDAESHFKLGLALNEIGKLGEAADALEQAVRIDPQFAQAWYNLGLACSALEQPERALEALVRAESIASSSPAIPYARATILARLGRGDEARSAARRALEIQPGFGDAANLLRILAADRPGGNNPP